MANEIECPNCGEIAIMINDRVVCDHCKYECSR